MSKNWAISIGINQYDNLQPMNFAKRDAEAMAAWFREEAKFDQVFLFTEDSPPINTSPPIPTQPTYGRLRRFLQAQFEQPLLEPGDNLWFFFAGHGMRHADKDYLMFADSDPGDIEHTAISVEYITSRLRRSCADNVVLFLDACREEGSRSGLGIGEQKHQGVITFYSCAANQKSWEIAELQHGSFTHTLLTGLRLHGEANCATVERLDRYLNSAVPQLNTRYQKPIQNPYLKAEPPYKMYYILLEQAATIKDIEVLKKYQASITQNEGNFILAEDGSQLITEDGSQLITEDSLKYVAQNMNKTEQVIKLYQIGGLKGAGNDVVADKDHLGFNHYVKAFADLIESPYTKPPLTIGIFGSWGMGKSFLLDHITRELQERGQKRFKEQRHKRKKPQTNPPLPRVHIVKFNAWEYSAAKHIWTGLVRKIMNQLEKEVSWGFPGLFWKKFFINLKREFEDNKSKIILFFAVLAGFLVLNIFKFKINGQLIWSGLVAIGVTGIFKLVADTLSKPLSQWIETVLKGTDYGKQINYMEEIHSDLELLAQRLQNNNGRVLIIIDDLDRCEPQKAVEVLQAVNLLLNFKSFIVCLGIDARIITRAVEKHYSNVLGTAGASGYEYLDKIVQIPFRIPEPNPDEIKIFISEQLGNPQPPISHNSSPNTPVQPVQTSIATTSDTGQSNSSRLSFDSIFPSPGESPKIENTENKKISQSDESPSLVAFSYDELEAFYHFVRYLRPNPRHLKRLINVYRLVRTLAEYKGEDFILNNPFATIRWLVICGQWPYTIYAMLYYFGEMLERVEEEKMKSLPENVDPLEYLHTEVISQFKNNSSALLKQRKLDHDLDLLRMLLQRKEGRLTWDELDKLRQYTVNFNPAVEATLKAEVPVSLLID